MHKEFIGAGQSFRDVDPLRAKDVAFYKEFGGYNIQITYDKKNQISGVIEQKYSSPYTALQYYSSGKELMIETLRLTMTFGRRKAIREGIPIFLVVNTGQHQFLTIL